MYAGTNTDLWGTTDWYGVPRTRPSSTGPWPQASHLRLRAYPTPQARIQVVNNPRHVRHCADYRMSAGDQEQPRGPLDARRALLSRQRGQLRLGATHLAAALEHAD